MKKTKGLRHQLAKEFADYLIDMDDEGHEIWDILYNSSAPNKKFKNAGSQMHDIFKKFVRKSLNNLDGQELQDVLDYACGDRECVYDNNGKIIDKITVLPETPATKTLFGDINEHK